jgi:hypothetical protein
MNRFKIPLTVSFLSLLLFGVAGCDPVQEVRKLMESQVRRLGESMRSWHSAVKMVSRRNFGKMTAPNLHLSDYHKTKQKRPKVRFLYSPLLPMGCEARGVAFRVALPKSSRFSSRASRQNTGF